MTCLRVGVDQNWNVQSSSESSNRMSTGGYESKFLTAKSKRRLNRDFNDLRFPLICRLTELQNLTRQSSVFEVNSNDWFNPQHL